MWTRVSSEFATFDVRGVKRLRIAMDWTAAAVRFVAGEKQGQASSDHRGPSIFVVVLGKVPLFFGDSPHLGLSF